MIDFVDNLGILFTRLNHVFNPKAMGMTSYLLLKVIPPKKSKTHCRGSHGIS